MTTATTTRAAKATAGTKRMEQIERDAYLRAVYAAAREARAAETTDARIRREIREGRAAAQAQQD